MKLTKEQITEFVYNAIANNRSIDTISDKIYELLQEEGLAEEETDPEKYKIYRSLLFEVCLDQSTISLTIDVKDGWVADTQFVSMEVERLIDGGEMKKILSADSGLFMSRIATLSDEDAMEWINNSVNTDREGDLELTLEEAIAFKKLCGVFVEIKDYQKSV